ncbi:hypothetical protein JCM11491_006913 [Sporobolomyces phaffii]
MGVQQQQQEQREQQKSLTHSRIVGFGVYVLVNGKRAPLYARQEIDNKTIAYMEAVEGASFSVHTLDLRGRLDFGYTTDVCLDGMRCRSVFIEKDRYSAFPVGSGDSLRTVDFKAQDESDTTERPFFFGKLQTTDDDDIATTDENLVRNLGTIQALYRRGEMTHNPAAQHHSSTFNGDALVHEKNKKAALSHRATLGASVPVHTPKRSVSVRSFDPPTAPYACYEIRYRSRELLQLEGHMPDDAPPFVAAPLAPAPNGAAGSTKSDGVGSDGLTRRERIAKMRARLAADSSDDDEILRVDVRPKKAKIEVKAEARNAPKGKVKPEVLVLSDSD